ncbi:MAG: GNAT family N-acetyltransferase [Psychromonas sp.]
MTITFNRVLTLEQVNEVYELARVIWTEHYTPIIGLAQVKYMLERLHSADIIQTEVNQQNKHYYLIYNGQKAIGYIGFSIEQSHLFLSKIYVLSSERGNGIGKHALAFIAEQARSNHLTKISLTVNKNNSNSITAYQKTGFTITGDVCSDIGEGYVMDDYQMQLLITQ